MGTDWAGGGGLGQGGPPPAQVQVLDGVGHLPHMEKSGEMNRLIRAMIS